MVAVVFWLCSAVAVAAAIAVFVVDSMARASYALAVSFIAVGAILLVFGLDYLGVITILMMIMEMAIMAVFMVMYMGMNPALMPMDMTHAKRPALAVSVATFVALAVVVVLTPWPSRGPVDGSDATRVLGEALMDSKMLVMLTISPVLFATIVAGIVLANPRGRYDRKGDRLDGAADDAERGGLGV